MIISVDLGYGYVKSLNEDKGKVKFPSVIAPAPKDVLGSGLGFTSDIGYKVKLRGQNSLKDNHLYIGDLAIREGRAAQMTLSRDRFKRDAAISLTMVAAYLSGAEGSTILAAGLPLAYYKNQKDQTRKALTGVSAYVSVGEEEERMITFSQVHVFPQGVGAVYGHDKLPDEGLFGIIDVGYHTTDYLLIEVANSGLSPLYNFTSTVELGMHTALKIFAKQYTDQTGKPLSLIDAQRLWDKKDLSKLSNNLNVDLSALKKAAKLETGRAISESVANAWSEQLDFIEQINTVGGGAIEFNDMLSEYLGETKLMKDPQFGNCRGFLKLAELKERQKQEFYNRPKAVNKG